jgi:hypothetical protein
MPTKQGKDMHIIRNLALRAAAIAVLGTSAAPAIAAAPFDVSVKEETSAFDSDVSEYRRYGRYGRHRHDRIDGGDIVAGIGILAGIAIIADIASKSKSNKQRTRGDRYPEQYPDSFPRDSRDNSAERNIRSGDDVGSAVSLCSAAAERTAGKDSRVDEIRSVTREGSGWQVAGDLSGANQSFTCTVSGGQVQDIRLDNSRAI